MNLRIALSLVLFLILPRIVPAQYYDTGQDPANLKWLQIKSDRFRVIYPEKYGSQGIEFTKSLDKAYSDLGALFPGKKFRIPVIIHNFTTQSNGYVAWAPKRMEIYPTPEQNTIPLDANRQLALHELTHVMQMESLNTGFTKVMSYLLGQQFTGIVSSLLPLWYLEGDAVFAETTLSESGRGRSAGFQKQLKAIVIEKDKPYKYDKMIQESFRDLVPDHYQFGYQMVAWARINNLQTWNKTLEYTADYPFTINPVNLSLRKNSGITKKKLYYQTFDTLKTLWKKDLSNSGARTYDALNPQKKERFVNYHSPLAIGIDSVIAIKTSLSGIPEFVLVRPSGKTEKKLHYPGNIYPFFISFGGGKLVWAETSADPRWENRNYSVIKIMDLKNGSVRQLSRRSRFMAASISPDGKCIAASENSAENINSLVLFSPEDKYNLKKIPAPVNASLQRPQWSEDGKKITVIYLTEEGEGIMSYNMDDGMWEILLPTGRDDLQTSFLRNDSLFYISSVNGTDNVYLIDHNKSVTQVTNSRFGANDLSLRGSTILFCDYTSSGNNICSVSLNEAMGKTSKAFIPVSYLADRFEINKGNVYDAGSKTYTPEPYRKWQHLSGIHSWMPFYADIEEIQADPASIRPGATIMTQNQLSTLTVTASYEYSELKDHLMHARISWKGWYPVFESQIDYGTEPLIYNVRTNGTPAPDPAETTRGYQFRNTISLPLSVSSGRFNQFFYLAGISNYYNDYLYINESSTYTRGLTQLAGRFYFTNFRKSALRDLYPEWAQSLDIMYSWYPFNSDYLGSSLSFRSALYFPGGFRDHSIRIRLEAEKQTTPFKYYRQGNRISFPRSYNDISSNKAGFLSADYIMPLAYPDFNITSLLYLKRIRAVLFYDYTRGTGNSVGNYADGVYKIEFHNYSEEFKSFGLQLLSDFYLFRIPYMISAGVETAFRSFDETPYFRLLFNIDIYGMSIGRRMHL
ncbi:MAG: hypothetical protein MUF36_04725 [Bacteroidales bacterium]|jgi:hypothetical protein|nr:hypothetical protein [Bacteroidales bacterium]